VEGVKVGVGDGEEVTVAGFSAGGGVALRGLVGLLPAVADAVNAGGEINGRGVSGVVVTFAVGAGAHWLFAKRMSRLIKAPRDRKCLFPILTPASIVVG
jgi:hypothetical protein